VQRSNVCLSFSVDGISSAEMEMLIDPALFSPFISPAYPTKIQSKKEAAQLPFVGEKLAVLVRRHFPV
jgi:hypothetical protein